MPVHSAASATDTGSPWDATVASGTGTTRTGTYRWSRVQVLKCQTAHERVRARTQARGSHTMSHTIGSITVKIGTRASSAPTRTNTPTYTLEYGEHDGDTLARCSGSERTENDTSRSQLFHAACDHAIMQACASRAVSGCGGAIAACRACLRTGRSPACRRTPGRPCS